MTKQGSYHMQGRRGEINQVESERRSVVSDSLQPHGLCSPPGSSVHGILQTGILEWVAMHSSRGIFLTQEWNLCLLQLLHCRQILYH